MTENLVAWAMRIREQIPEIVGPGRSGALIAELDRLIDEGQRFAEKFDRFLQSEPRINDWLNERVNPHDDTLRSFQELPGRIRHIPSGVLARCENGHTWEMPDAASWLPPCPREECGLPLTRV
jgi:hypothetical protein